MLEKFHNKRVLKNHAFNEYLINWKMFSAKENIYNYTCNKSWYQRHGPKRCTVVLSGGEGAAFFFLCVTFLYLPQFPPWTQITYIIRKIILF